MGELKAVKKKMRFSSESSNPSVDISDSAESEWHKSSDESFKPKTRWLPVMKVINEHYIIILPGENRPYF
jgi:hypothetical protein